MLNLSHNLSHKLRMICLSVTGLLLVACHQEPTHGLQNDPLIKQAVLVATQGQKLTDAAARTVLSDGSDEASLQQPLDATALTYAGRYQASISCEDAFARCEQGNAEFILNLLPDGTAHRTFIHMGRVEFSSSRQYRQDHWRYDAEHHQIILHRESGVEFYYDLDPQHNLIINLELIANASAKNQEYFNSHPFPQKAYTLQRVKGT